jgi:hypothetical protein
MKPYFLVLATVIVVVMHTGCSAPADGRNTGVDPDTVSTSRPDEMQENASALIDDLVGQWVDDPGEDSTIFHEEWERLDPRHYQGLGFVMLGNDTVSIEHLNIHLTDTGTFYAAEIPTQNEGKPVYFKLTSANDSLVFENPQHDFPQRIVYQPQEPSGWIAFVSGAMQGQQRMMQFHLKPREAGTQRN